MSPRARKFAGERIDRGKNAAGLAYQMEMLVEESGWSQKRREDE